MILSFQVLLNQLRAVFDQIIELQNTQDAIYRAALEELQRRLQFEEKKQQREAEVWLLPVVYGFSDVTSPFLPPPRSWAGALTPAWGLGGVITCSHT